MIAFFVKNACFKFLLFQIVSFREKIDKTTIQDRFLNPDVVARSVIFSAGVVIMYTILVIIKANLGQKG
jgi:hypothetical protein